MPTFDDRFARQNRCGLPPEFTPASLYSGIVHHLAGHNSNALTRIPPQRATGRSTIRRLPPILVCTPNNPTLRRRQRPSATPPRTGLSPSPTCLSRSTAAVSRRVHPSLPATIHWRSTPEIACSSCSLLARRYSNTFARSTEWDVVHFGRATLPKDAGPGQASDSHLRASVQPIQPGETRRGKATGATARRPRRASTGAAPPRPRQQDAQTDVPPVWTDGAICVQRLDEFCNSHFVFAAFFIYARVEGFTFGICTISENSNDTLYPPYGHGRRPVPEDEAIPRRPREGQSLRRHPDDTPTLRGCRAAEDPGFDGLPSHPRPRGASRPRSTPSAPAQCSTSVAGSHRAPWFTGDTLSAVRVRSPTETLLRLLLPLSDRV